MTKNAPISKFAEELGQVISYIHRSAHSMLGPKSDALFQGRLTMPQYIALELLNSASKPLKMKDVAKGLRISLPAATGLVNRLVGMKLTMRIYDKGDRRVVLITLTPEGKNLADKTKKSRIKMIEEMFKDLSDQERAVYLKIIHKVKASLHGKTKKD